MLEKYAVDEHYEVAGIYYEDARDLIQCGILEFCGCGMPDDSLEYILGGLRIINDKYLDPVNFSKHDEWWAQHEAKARAHFKNNGEEYFFYYWADKEKISEHGGSAPGWLTDKGKELLAMLEEWSANRPDEDVGLN